MTVRKMDFVTIYTCVYYYTDMMKVTMHMQITATWIVMDVEDVEDAAFVE